MALGGKTITTEWGIWATTKVFQNERKLWEAKSERPADVGRSEANRQRNFTCDFIYITTDERLDDGLIFDFNHKVTAHPSLRGSIGRYADRNYIR